MFYLFQNQISQLQYFEYSQYVAQLEDNDHYMSLLEWWKFHCNEFRRTFEIGRNVSVLPSQANIERVNSIAGLVLNLKRHSMSNWY